MAKGVCRRLADASDLASVVQLRLSDLVCVSVWRDETRFQLTIPALGRVIDQFRVRRSAVSIVYDDNRNVHVKFRARGAVFVGYIPAAEAADWIASLEASQAVLTGQSCLAGESRPKGLPAPA